MERASVKEEYRNTQFGCCIIATVIAVILSFIFLTVALGVGWGLVMGPISIVLTVALGLTPILMCLSLISWFCVDDPLCVTLSAFICIWFMAGLAVLACGIAYTVTGSLTDGVDEQSIRLHIGSIVAGSFGIAAALLCCCSGIYALIGIIYTSTYSVDDTCI